MGTFTLGQEDFLNVPLFRELEPQKHQKSDEFRRFRDDILKVDDSGGRWKNKIYLIRGCHSNIRYCQRLIFSALILDATGAETPEIGRISPKNVTVGVSGGVFCMFFFLRVGFNMNTQNTQYQCFSAVIQDAWGAETTEIGRISLKHVITNFGEGKPFWLRLPNIWSWRERERERERHFLGPWILFKIAQKVA